MHAPSNHPGFDSAVQQFNLKSNEAVIRVVQDLRGKLLRIAQQAKQCKKNLSLLSPLKGHKKGMNLNSYPCLSPPLDSSLAYHSLLCLLMLHTITY